MGFGASYEPRIRFHGSMVLADSGETNVYCGWDYTLLLGSWEDLDLTVSRFQ